MGQCPEIQVFIEHVNTATDLDGLSRIVADITKHLGFEFFALGHHGGAISHQKLHISNFPNSWTEQFVAIAHLGDDPVVAACQKAIMGFLWSDIHRLVALTDRQKASLAVSLGARLGEGFTVPMHRPGACAGFCTFVTAPGQSVPSSVLPATQYLGCLAFEAARRLLPNAHEHIGLHPTQTVPRLSSRQIDCVVLAAQGKSDTDAGQLLGISNQTVHQHIEAAKRRYGVATRAQLIVHALFDSQIAYGEIIALPPVSTAKPRTAH